MATNTLPQFTAAMSNAPWEPKFIVRYPFEGVDYFIGFDTQDEVLHAVTSKKDRYGKYLPTDVVNLIVDFAEESLEWNARPPVAEAVYDSPVDEPVYDRPSYVAEVDCRFWRLAATSLLMVAAAAPWVGIVICVRWWVGA